MCRWNIFRLPQIKDDIVAMLVSRKGKPVTFGSMCSGWGVFEMTSESLESEIRAVTGDELASFDARFVQIPDLGYRSYYSSQLASCR
jgi:hypothetical protein